MNAMSARTTKDSNADLTRRNACIASAASAKSSAIDQRLTRTLPCSATLAVEHEGLGQSMSSRQTICATERTAANAGSAATLILGTLLLLIRP